MTTNKHGLSRYIELPKKREVRQRVRFGCIFDGNILVDYDHFDPEFSDCTEHRPDGITLLCLECHGKKTRKRLTNDMVARQNETPYCHTAPSAWTNLDWDDTPIEVRLGRTEFHGVGSRFTVYGVDILKVDPPEMLGAPFRLSARFFDRDGKETVRITDNHVEAMTDSWDVIEEANRITVRTGLGDISLQILHEPPNRFLIERLNMRYGDHIIELGNDGLISIDMIDSPMGPVRLGKTGGDKIVGDDIGLHIPAAGGFRIGHTRTSDAVPWGQDAVASWRDDT